MPTREIDVRLPFSLPCSISMSKKGRVRESLRLKKQAAWHYSGCKYNVFMVNFE